VLLAAAAALALRLWLLIGYQGHDDRSYIAYGWAVAQGGNIAALGLADPWVGRLGAWGPISLAIRLFGASEWVWVLHSMLASLASVALAGGLGWRLFSARAGVLAAALVALLPIDVMYGSSAFGDESAGFWCVMTLGAFVLVLRTGQARWGLAAGLAWGVAYLTKETAVLMAVPLALILWRARQWPKRALAALGSGFALVFAAELLFWLQHTGDALYRWHATLGARSAFIPPVVASSSWFDWVPRPIPSEIFRSQNSVVDAVLMFLTNEEWGLLFYLLPLALLWTVRRGPEPARWLAIFVVSMALLLAFFPLHFPHYTLGRDPRHFTQLGVPAILLLAVWLLQLAPVWRRVALMLLLGSWLPCLYVAHVSADVSVQRAFARYLQTPGQERVWMDSVLAADAIVLSGFAPNLPVGIVPPTSDLQALEPGTRPSGAVRALRPGIAVAQSIADLRGGLVAMAGSRQPAQAWTLAAEIKPLDGWLPQLAQRLLTALHLPENIVRKVGMSHGQSIRLYRVPMLAAQPA
jgi:4-amino-4-deoxy-L-arabinose transferase-like glycosyltransferase